MHVFCGQTCVLFSVAVVLCFVHNSRRQFQEPSPTSRSATCLEWPYSDLISAMCLYVWSDLTVTYYRSCVCMFWVTLQWSNIGHVFVCLEWPYSDLTSAKCLYVFKWPYSDLISARGNNIFHSMSMQRTLFVVPRLPKKFPYIMGPVSSLSSSKDSASCHCYKPDKTSPWPLILFLR